jgi:hypothetical protein
MSASGEMGTGVDAAGNGGGYHQPFMYIRPHDNAAGGDDVSSDIIIQQRKCQFRKAIAL